MIKPFHLPEFRDNRGRLAFVEEVTHLPFEIRCVYLLTGKDIPHTVSLTAPAFVMAPKGDVVINGILTGGIGYGIEISATETLHIDSIGKTYLLILSSETITDLSPLKLPFRPRRLYLMEKIPQGRSRGNHAHFTTSQMIYALQGSFDVELDNGTFRETVSIIPDKQPVEVQLGVWHTLHTFSEDAICMVLASELFNPEDYISEYPEFSELRKTILND